VDPIPDDDPEAPGGRTGATAPDGTGSERELPEPGPGGAGPVASTGDEELGEHQAVEGGAGALEPPECSDPLRFNTWMKRSATGAVLTGISLGLREALELRKNEPAIMIEASGEPEDPDNPIRLHFDPDDPRATVAVIRMPSDGPEPGASRAVAPEPVAPEPAAPDPED
jgi:hypothetical protein